MGKLNRSVVVVTGGSRGIGWELVIKLSEQGYSVITTSRSQNSVDSLNSLTNVQAYQMDLEEDDSIARFVSWIKENKLIPSYLINNAGTATMGSLEFVSDLERLSLVKTNLLGPISLTRQLIPVMDKQDGKIINMSSDEGLITLPYSVDYAITKHAFDAFSEGLHYELRKTNIQVITINPGMVKTRLFDTIIKKIEQRQIIGMDRDQSIRFLQEKLKLVEDALSNKRGPEPSEIANEVIQIMNLSNTLPQYLMTSPSETEYVITTLIDRLVLLNSSSPFSFTLEELQEKLAFSHDALESLGKI